MQILSKTDNSVHVTDKLGVEGALKLADERLREAVDYYKPVWLSGGLSGGNDSIAATYIASRHPQFRSAFHIDTGVGLRATEDFVAELCPKMGWPLEVYKALENVRADGTPDPQDYFAMVEERGFPGPAMHWKMYQRLKERQIYRWCRDHKKFHSRQLLMLVSGRRTQESKRRERTVVGPHERPKKGPAVAWANPAYDFSKLDCRRVAESREIPESPVYKFIHKSGECLCGAFGTEEELRETAAWFPNDPTVIRLLATHERMKKERGWGWGGRPPGTGRQCKIKKAGPMCAACDLKYAHEQELNLRPFADTNPGR